MQQEGGGNVKVKIELIDGLEEPEIVIRCDTVDDTVQSIHRFIAQQSPGMPKVVFYQGDTEYYFPLDDILFFETESEQVYAHTASESYRIKYKLYELEDLLPRQFVRVAKSTIVNANRVYSVRRDLTSSSLIQFASTHKNVYASRHYYKNLRERLSERSNHER